MPHLFGIDSPEWIQAESVLGLIEEYAADPSQLKTDLTVGVYREL